MKPIAKILESVIQGADAAALRPDTILKTIPGWDSMNAINFLLEVESNYSIDLSQLDLSKLATFGQLCDSLSALGVPASALAFESRS